MKKLLAKLLSAILIIACVTNVIGCSKTKKVDNSVEDTTNLHIVAIERGYGTKMIDEWEKAFESIYEDVEVHVTKVVEISQVTTYFELGSDYSDYDIFFTLDAVPGAVHEGTKSSLGGLMDYTDIYNSKCYDEDVTLLEKMNPKVAKLMTGIDEPDKYYGMPWTVATQSIVLNETVTAQALGEDYKVPNTTDELWDFANSIKDAGYTPFVYPGQLDYWASTFFTWWAQYEGIEAYEKFYEGKIYDEAQEQYVYSHKVYEQQGRLESLKVMESLLVQDNGFHLNNVNDYNQNNFTVLQKAFLNSFAATSNDKKYAMFPNGDWIATESFTDNSDDIIMMKMPIVSSIINVLPDVSVENDAELSKVIDAIDSGNTALSGEGYSVTQNDYNRLKEARDIVYSQVNTHAIYSPAYTNAKDLVKKFLLFIASDQGIKIYNDNVKPGFLPLEYDYPEKEKFANSVRELIDKTFISKSYNTYLAANKGIAPTSFNSGYYEAVLGVLSDSKQHRTAQQIFDAEKVSEEQFTFTLRNLGLIK